MGLEVVTPVSTEPITLDIARRHLRLDVSGTPPAHPDDAYLEGVTIPAARATLEDYTGRALAPATYRLLLDAFPDGAIELPRPPLVSIQSVVYADPDGVDRVLAPTEYAVDTGQQLAWLLPAVDSAWPATLDAANVVQITYIAGYERANVPPPLMSAMLLMLTNLYDHRGSLVIGTISSELPQSVASLAWAYRVRKGMA